MPDDSDGDDENAENGDNGCEQAEIEVVVADRSKCVSVRACGNEDESAEDLEIVVRRALADADSRTNQDVRGQDQERCFQ